MIREKNKRGGKGKERKRKNVKQNSEEKNVEIVKNIWWQKEIGLSEIYANKLWIIKFRTEPEG